MDEQRQVLIVGGSMVGLSAAMFLAHQGIRPLLVERHAEISAHPRAQAASPRTMELLRPLGLEPAIRAKETPNARYGNIVQVESLAGAERGWFDGPFRHDTHGASATGWTLIGQDRLEPILRDHAEKLGADIRFGTELVRYEQDDSGVSAVIRDLGDGSESTVRAEYLIAADGNRSPIRDGLGIGTHGQGVFGRQMIVLFQADLTEYVRGREFFLCFVSNDSVHGVLGQLGATSDGRWCLAVSLAADESHEAYTEQQCADLVRAAVGVPELAVKIEDVDSWEIAARIADRFRDRRVLLAGDSAHVMPPTGGFGGNMGIQDAHNLAWKLALVLDGRAGEELLNTYQSERAPVAEFTVEQGVIRYLLRSGLDEETKRRHRPEATVLFGHVYDEDGSIEDPTEPSLRPGTRAPFHPVADGDVHDLMRGRFVLLATPEVRWPDAAAEAAARLDVSIDAHELDESFQRRYGIEPGGAVLVRPDGFIAWRTTELPEDPAGALVDVLGQFLHLPAWVG